MTFSTEFFFFLESYHVQTPMFHSFAENWDEDYFTTEHVHAPCPSSDPFVVGFCHQLLHLRESEWTSLPTGPLVRFFLLAVRQLRVEESRHRVNSSVVCVSVFNQQLHIHVDYLVIETLAGSQRLHIPTKDVCVETFRNYTVRFLVGVCQHLVLVTLCCHVIMLHAHQSRNTLLHP